VSRVLLVRAPGLSYDLAIRGDEAAHLSDLVAEGSLARLEGAVDLGGRPGEGRIEVVDLPCGDLAAFDAALGGLRERAAARGEEIVVLSEGVLVSQKVLPGVRPGKAVAGAEVPRLLDFLSA
jgi:hypothetical protein